MRYNSNSKFEFYFKTIGNLLYYGALIGAVIVLIVAGILKLFGWDDHRKVDVCFYTFLLIAWVIGILVFVIISIEPLKKKKK